MTVLCRATRNIQICALGVFFDVRWLKPHRNNVTAKVVKPALLQSTDLMRCAIANV